MGSQSLTTILIPFQNSETMKNYYTNMSESSFFHFFPQIDSYPPHTPNHHQLTSPKKQKQQTNTLILKKPVKNEMNGFAEGRIRDLQRFKKFLCLELIFSGIVFLRKIEEYGKKVLVDQLSRSVLVFGQHYFMSGNSGSVFF
jgi:hypothetical protein